MRNKNKYILLDSSGELVTWRSLEERGLPYCNLKEVISDASFHADEENMIVSIYELKLVKKVKPTKR